LARAIDDWMKKFAETNLSITTSKVKTMSNAAYVYDAVRTPRSKGKKDGKLHEVKPIDLGAGVLKALEQRNDQFDTSYVDDVIYGCVAPVGEQGADIGKACAQNAGWHESVAGFQLNRFCGSGLEAVNIAAQKVMSGWDSLVVAGGVECMSRIPMGSDGGALAQDAAFVIQESFVPQGIGADMIATIDGYTREDVDAFAVESQRRAAHARDNGYFKSVVPVLGRGGEVILDKDDFIKPATTMEALGGLNPSFELMGQFGFDEIILRKYNQYDTVNHVHTPGNSSGIVDGSAAVLIGSEQAGKDLGLTPRARIIGGSILSSDPVIMLTGPGPSAKKALKTAGLTENDIDLWEINEAFASVAMRYMKDLNIDSSVTNVNGGAIAMGHPLGATGAMLVSTMVDELERTGKKRALISLCIGGGMGISCILERV